MDKQFKHIMVDGETLSTKRNAVIPSIALVKFDPATGETGEQLHVTFDVQEQIDNGYHVSASTLAFWLKQERPARMYLADILDEKDPHTVTRAQGMTHVYNFIKNTPNATVWGNGISFDLGLLIEEFEDTGLPWKFWNERDVRTIVELCYMFKMPDYKNHIPMNGTAHHPVDDCLHQIEYTSCIIKHLAIPFEAKAPVADEMQLSYADHAKAEEAAAKAEFNLSRERSKSMPAALGMPYGEKLSHDATYDKPKRKNAMVAIVRTLHEAKNYGDTAYRVAVNDMLVASGINPKEDEVLVAFNSMGTLGLEVLAVTLSKMADNAVMAAATRDTIKKADEPLRTDIQTMVTQAYREDRTPEIDSLLVKMGLPIKRDISVALKELSTDALVALAVELRFFVLPPKVKGE